MAEEKKTEEHPLRHLAFIAVVLGGLILLWFFSGGPQKADLRGIFLNPPPPVGTGDAYGPQVGQPAQPVQSVYQPPEPVEF